MKCEFCNSMATNPFKREANEQHNTCEKHKAFRPVYQTFIILKVLYFFPETVTVLEVNKLLKKITTEMDKRFWQSYENKFQ